MLEMIILCDTNQSHSPSDTVTEIVIDKDVCKHANSKNEISGNVESDEVVPSLGDACSNTETVQDTRSEEQQPPPPESPKKFSQEK